MNKFEGKRTDIKQEVKLNPCNAAFVQFCAQLANCLDIPRDSLVLVDEKAGKINSLPLSANFGSTAEMKTSSIISDSVIFGEKKEVDYPVIFEFLKYGLIARLDDHKDREKNEKRKEEIIFYDPEEMIRHLDFMVDMAEILGQDMFGFEGELIVILGEMGIAAGININDVLESDEFGQTGFTPQIDQKTRIIIKKRAMLLKAVEKDSSQTEMTNDDRGMLHNIIIPVRNNLQDCLGESFPLQGEWLKLARGEPFGRKQTNLDLKLVGKGNRGVSVKHPGRGSIGPGRHSGGK